MQSAMRSHQILFLYQRARDPYEITVSLFFRQLTRIQSVSSVQPEEPMIKRIEFSLNLEDPREAAIYRALKPSLRYRRAGSVIRQALDSLLITETVPPQSASIRRQNSPQESNHEQA